jgi:hypothetical protein
VNHPGKHGAGRIRRRAIEREDAIARGVDLGRNRQLPSLKESDAYRARGLEDCLWHGFDRGRKARARLEQLSLELA